MGSVAAVAIAVASWQAVATIRVADKPLLATPWETVAALPAASRAIVADLLATTVRAGLGLAMGIAIGVTAGLIAAVGLRRAPALEGMLDFARSVPPVVVFPVFLLAFGYSETARVATIAAGCAWPMALSVTTAAAAKRSVRREILALSGATRLEALLWTQPWEALPALTVGLHASASTAVVVAVVTEMIVGVDRGIGGRVVSAQIASDTTMLTLSILAIGIVGYAVNVALRRLAVWAEQFA